MSQNEHDKWELIQIEASQEEPDDYITGYSGKLIAVNAHDEEVVGSIKGLYCDLKGAAYGAGFEADDVLDAHSAAVAEYIQILDEVIGGFDETYNNFIIIDRVEIKGEYRGHGLGLDAMRLLARFLSRWEEKVFIYSLCNLKAAMEKAKSLNNSLVRSRPAETNW